MKITDITLQLAQIPQRDETPESTSLVVLRQQMALRLHTDEGLVGIGECFNTRIPGGVRAVMEKGLKPLLLGQDPLDRERLWELMYRQTYSYGRRGLALWAISGVDIALWDLAGKVAGLPVYRLLGGPMRPRVPAYASLPRLPDPEWVAEVLRWRMADGFRAFKLHAHDLKSMETARRTVGDGAPVYVDVNGAYDRREAIAMTQEMRKLDMGWLEEPIFPLDDYEGLAQITAQSGVPIAAGENESTHYGFREVISKRAVDILQPSVARVGGLTAALKVAAMGDAWGLKVASHSFYYGANWMAALHLIASIPNGMTVETPAALKEDFVIGRPKLVDGELELPTAPGLGIELDDDVLAKYAVEE